jgi:hypothetical protein
MQFHLPKPLHGWREFAGEVGIIVIGVLIALGAQQVVETIHWGSQAHETEQTLRAEIQDSLNSVAERRTLDGCLRWQLIALRAAAIGRGPPPKGTVAGDGSREIPDAYATPWRAWAQGSWQSAIASGVLNHVSPSRLSAYSQAYKAIEDLDGIVRQERLTKGALAPLALGPAAAVTASSVLTAVTNLDRNRADMLVAGGDLISAAAVLGIKPDASKAQS